MWRTLRSIVVSDGFNFRKQMCSSFSLTPCITKSDHWAVLKKEKNELRNICMHILRMSPNTFRSHVCLRRLSALNKQKQGQKSANCFSSHGPFRQLWWLHFNAVQVRDKKIREKPIDHLFCTQCQGETISHRERLNFYVGASSLLSFSSWAKDVRFWKWPKCP